MEYANLSNAVKNGVLYKNQHGEYFKTKLGASVDQIESLLSEMRHAAITGESFHRGTGRRYLQILLQARKNISEFTENNDKAENLWT